MKLQKMREMFTSINGRTKPDKFATIIKMYLCFNDLQSYKKRFASTNMI